LQNQKAQRSLIFKLHKESLVKPGLNFLLALTISVTGVALRVPAAPLLASTEVPGLAANAEARFRLQYEQTEAVLPKLKPSEGLDLALPASEFPYTDFVKSHESFYKKYLLVIRWLAGQSALPMTCNSKTVSNIHHSDESLEAMAEREARSLQVGQDGLRNFEITEYITEVPGFKDCGVSRAESAAIYDYTNSFYQKLNPALRQRTRDLNITAFAKTLDLALDKLAPYKGWVKRGTNFSAETKAKYVKGAIVSDLAYTSTSRNKQFNGDDQLTIYSKTGRYIATLSATHAEEEVLFKRGTKFLVTEVYPDKEDPYVQHYTLIEQ
jgi:hypothetical protein